MLSGQEGQQELLNMEAALGLTQAVKAAEAWLMSNKMVHKSRNGLQNRHECRNLLSGVSEMFVFLFQ